MPEANTRFERTRRLGRISMAATLTERYQAPLVVFLGATLALITKGVLALAIGFGLRNRVPISILRPVSASLCVIMGVISAVSPIFTPPQSH